MAKIGSLWLSLFLILSPQWSLAGVAVRASIEQTQVGVSEPFELTIAVVSDSSVDVSEPSVGQIPGFQIVRAWSSSSRSEAKMSFSNGRPDVQVSRTTEFHYLLQPEKVGPKQKIPAFQVVVDGKTYNTQAFTVDVVPDSQAAKRSQPPMFEEDEDDPVAQAFQQLLRGRDLVEPFERRRPRGSMRPPENVNPKELFFLHADVDKKEVYEGEQITVTWSLYTRGTLRHLDRLKFPDLKGFWKEIIEEVPALSFETEVINGVRYDRALLAAHALFPIKPGVAVIDEYKVRAQVYGPNSFGFGMGQGYTFNRSSERVKITVKPLPNEGRPSKFSGAVGAFEIAASLVSDRAVVNEPIALKVRISGKGNAKLIEFPDVKWPTELELYDKKEDSKFFKDGTSYKEFEVLLIPRASGDLVIPSIPLSQFDPAQKVYKVTQSQPLKISVTGSATPKTEAPSTSFLGSKPQTREKVLPAPLLEDSSRWLTNKWPLRVALALFFSLGILWLLWMYRRDFVEISFHEKLSREIRSRERMISKMFRDKKSTAAVTETLNVLNSSVQQMVDRRGGSSNSKDFVRLLDALPLSTRNLVSEKLLRAHQMLEQHAFAPEALRAQLPPPQEVSKDALGQLKKLVRKDVE